MRQKKNRIVSLAETVHHLSFDLGQYKFYFENSVLCLGNEIHAV